jgi:hypothetical protein
MKNPFKRPINEMDIALLAFYTGIFAAIYLLVKTQY